VQNKMGRSCGRLSRHHGLKFAPRFESVQFFAAPDGPGRRVSAGRPGSDRQALAALGTPCIDNGAAATGFHTNQKAVGAGATDFGRLVSAFHDDNPKGLGKGPNTLNEYADHWHFLPQVKSGEPGIITNFGPTSKFGVFVWSSACLPNACIGTRSNVSAQIYELWINS
jgi:hypothetical protein